MKTKKIKCFRHGEICFITTDKIPDGLVQVDNNEFLKGSHGNPHTFDKGELFLKDVNEFIFGYFISKNTTLFHKEHGKGKGKLKKSKLPDGIYMLSRQNEIINDELKKVID